MFFVFIYLLLISLSDDEGIQFLEEAATPASNNLVDLIRLTRACAAPDGGDAADVKESHDDEEAAAANEAADDSGTGEEEDDSWDDDDGRPNPRLPLPHTLPRTLPHTLPHTLPRTLCRARWVKSTVSKSGYMGVSLDRWRKGRGGKTTERQHRWKAVVSNP